MKLRSGKIVGRRDSKPICLLYIYACLWVISNLSGFILIAIVLKTLVTKKDVSFVLMLPGGNM